MGGICYSAFCINLLLFVTSWGLIATSKIHYVWLFSVQYLVQNPLSRQTPVGTATLCLGNSCLMTAGRLHSSQLPAQPHGLKLSSMRFSVRGAPDVKGLVSDIRSQQGTVLSVLLGGAPAGLTLNTVLSGEWKFWKEKRWW